MDDEQDTEPTPEEMAFTAGRAAAATEPGKRRHPDSCPFAPGTSEALAWLDGFSAALDEQHARFLVLQAGQLSCVVNGFFALFGDPARCVRHFVSIRFWKLSV